MEEFFKDLKVIELSSVLAGPAAGLFFAELGAQVLKVENKLLGGDVTRSWRIPDEPSQGPSAYYAAVNFYKTVLSLDLTLPAHRKQLFAELEDADILITNYTPRVARKLNLEAELIREQFPKLIVAEIKGFNRSERQAYDVVLQAESGWISMTGSQGFPAKLPVALIDVIAGHQLKEACLLALLHRSRTGSGSHVWCSLEDAALASLSNQATNYLMNGKVAKPMATLHPNIAPYGEIFSCADQARIVLAVGSDSQFESLCIALNMDLYQQPEFATNQQRLAHRQTLMDKLSSAMGKMSYPQLEQALAANQVPFGKVKNLDEVLDAEAVAHLIRKDIQEGRPCVRLTGNAFGASFLGGS